MEQIGDLVNEIKHVGSTSIPGLCAKPIIDIVAIMESYEVFAEIVSRLEKVGFNKRSSTRGTSIYGKWETTGGAVVASEDSLTTALRETKEELGIYLIHTMVFCFIPP